MENFFTLLNKILAVQTGVEKMEHGAECKCSEF